MSDAAAPAAHAATTAPTRRGFWRGLRDIVLCSLAVTAAAAVIALPIALLAEARWSLVFVISRWICVAILLATPLLHQAAVRLGVGWRMPWVLATPATALLLTTESIILDIISARLSG